MEESLFKSWRRSTHLKQSRPWSTVLCPAGDRRRSEGTRRSRPAPARCPASRGTPVSGLLPLWTQKSTCESLFLTVLLVMCLFCVVFGCSVTVWCRWCWQCYVVSGVWPICVVSGYGWVMECWDSLWCSVVLGCNWLRREEVLVLCCRWLRRYGGLPVMVVELRCIVCGEAGCIVAKYSWRLWWYIVLCCLWLSVTMKC